MTVVSIAPLSTHAAVAAGTGAAMERGFCKEFLGYRIRGGAIRPAQKDPKANRGIRGSMIEDLFRNSTEGRRHTWSDRNAPLPDCGEVEIKVITLKPDGKGGYHTGEDLCIGMMSSESLAKNFEKSSVRAKLNVLVVGLVEKGNDLVIEVIRHVDLRAHPGIRKDYARIKTAWKKRCQSMTPEFAIDGLGAESRAWGEFLKAKTKGAGKLPVGVARTRAFYLYARHANALVAGTFVTTPVIPGAMAVLRNTPARPVAPLVWSGRNLSMATLINGTRCSLVRRRPMTDTREAG